MKQKDWSLECKKYSSESFWWLNMLFAKDTQDVVITIKYLIHNCLKCAHKESCTNKHELVKFLEANDMWPWVAEWKN